MELRHLRYFVAVAEELHFGRAAKRLNISQPPLSQTIAQLEKEIGAKLFLRTKRVVQLTNAGEYFLKETYRILNDLDKVVDQTRRIELGETGKLEIGYTGGLSSKIIEIINTFKTTYPEVKVILNRMSSSNQLKALQEKRIQLGFLCPPIDSTFLHAQHIHGAPFVVALPSSHRLAKDTSPIDLKELANEDFIISPRSHEPGYYDTIISICNKSGIFPKIHQEAEGLTTILALVSAGIGVSLVSRFAMETKRKELTFREIKGYNTDIDLFLAWRNDNDLPIVEHFVHITQKCL